MRPVTVVSIGLVLLAAGAGGWALWSAVGQRGPLVGELRHDFGQVLIPQDMIEVHHDFLLTNHSTDPIVIQSVKSSCGCTTVRPTQNVVQAGASVELPTTLRLSGSGTKQAHIDVLIDEEGTPHKLVLHVQGTGRRQQSLWTQEPVVVVRPGMIGMAPIQYELFESGVKPPDPTFETDPAFETEFTGWTQKQSLDESKGRPVMWSGRVRVRQVGEAFVPGTELLITVSDAELRMPIVDQQIFQPAQRNTPPLPGVESGRFGPGSGPKTPRAGSQPAAPESQPESPPDDG